MTIDEWNILCDGCIFNPRDSAREPCKSGIDLSIYSGVDICVAYRPRLKIILKKCIDSIIRRIK